MVIPRSILVRLTTLLIVISVGAWFVVKPVRVIAPTAVGVVCPTASICIDDATKFDQATALYLEAGKFLAPAIGAPQGVPRVTFCHTENCANAFGLGDRSAVTVGTLGTVVGPRAWRPYYVRHEMIHYLQAERLGVLSLLFKPQWFVEGMAYGLSEDPRAPLSAPFEGYRARFKTWYEAVGPTRLWTEATRL